MSMHVRTHVLMTPIVFCACACVHISVIHARMFMHVRVRKIVLLYDCSNTAIVIELIVRETKKVFFPVGVFQDTTDIIVKMENLLLKWKNLPVYILLKHSSITKHQYKHASIACK